jgi:hypothetical protein
MLRESIVVVVLVDVFLFLDQAMADGSSFSIECDHSGVVVVGFVPLSVPAWPSSVI